MLSTELVETDLTIDSNLFNTKKYRKIPFSKWEETILGKIVE